MIGFFDSGLGGFTILSAVRLVLPEYDYLYYGDTKNLPYGDKSEAEIYALTKRGVEDLFERGALLVIVACNTASAESLRILQDTVLTGEYADRKILGVIIPTIEALIEADPQHALIIGTTRTIASKKYERELEKVNTRIRVKAVATPELVPLIEGGDIVKAYEMLTAYLRREGELDALVLGCTHYTLLKDFIRNNYSCTVISQDEIIPEKLKSYLRNHPEIEGRLTRGSTLEIFSTGETEFLNALNL